MSLALDLLIRATVIMLLGLGVRALLRNRSAELRSTVLRATLVGLASLALVSLAGIRWEPLLPGPKPEPIVLTAGVLDSLVSAETSDLGTPWMSIVWMTLAGLAFVGPVVGAICLRRIWARSQSIDAKGWAEVEDALGEMAVHRLNPAYVRVGPIDTPLVFGSVRPRLLLPTTFSTWPESHRRFALLHEAAHLKRFDCAWLAFATCLRAVYACHPLAWWLSRALSDEAELAADERAIRSGVEATDYASALIAIARDLQRPGRLVHSQGVTFMNHRQLDRRVRGALSARRRGSSLIAMLTLASSVIASTLGIALVHPKQAEPEIFVMQDPVAPVKSAQTTAARRQTKSAKTPVPGRPAHAPKATRARSTPALAPGTPAPSAPTFAATPTPGRAAAPAAPNAGTVLAQPGTPVSPARAPISTVPAIARPGTPVPEAPTAAGAAAAPTDPLIAQPAQGERKLSEAEMKAIVEEVLRRLKQGEKAGDDAKSAIEKERALLGALTRTGVAIRSKEAMREVELARTLAAKVGTLPARTAEGLSLLGQAVKVDGRLLAKRELELAQGMKVTGKLQSELAKKELEAASKEAQQVRLKSLLGSIAQTANGQIEIVVIDEKGRKQTLKVPADRLRRGTLKIVRGKDGKLRIE